MVSNKIFFNRPFMTGKEIGYIVEAWSAHMLAGDGLFTKKCHKWLELHTGCSKALLTHSCTAALEMAALLIDIQAGDEVIMPSYTFVSTANAFVLRGGVPVFVDIRADSLNMDEALIDQAITARTKAIVPVHYAGVACEMDPILSIARRRGLRVIEDAAQGLMASYKGRPLGSMGDLGTYSFHETKNVISGEGGAILVNDPALSAKAEIIREKGTDRSKFFRGEVDKYTWQEMGSSFLPGELIAAFLWAQLEAAEAITQERMRIWRRYYEMLAPFEAAGVLRRPTILPDREHNGHIFYIILSPEFDRQAVLENFRNSGIYPVFHYVPLHSSPAGRRFGRAHGELRVTDDLSARLIRLPLWIGLTDTDQDRIIDVLAERLAVR
jgi:dTDP-4-amino-4,6-dideoxygalactose transaminase